MTDMISEMNDYGRRRIPFLFIIDADVRSPRCIPLSCVDDTAILYAIDGLTNSRTAGGPSPACDDDIVLRRHPVPYTVYRQAFDKAIAHLGAGNTYLLNLTFPTRIDINISLRDLFFRSSARYKLWLRDSFVVFSPESFVKIHDHIIAAFPMKGTIDASVEEAESMILRDEKEHAEHVTIVDLLRNDLSRIARHVTVKRFRYIEKIRTNRKDLLQVSSEITGELDEDYNERIGDIIFSLLPAGSVTGAPKKKTMEIIRNIEPYPRGFYTGIFGCFDGRSMDSAVMIRFIEKDSGGYAYRSGGGITIYSDPRKEYRELIDKVYVPIV